MITSAQLRCLHFLLRQTSLLGQKAVLVGSFSNGRTESSKALSFEEAGALIRYLKEQLHPPDTQDSGNQMRRKIISIFHKLGWEKPDGKIDIGRLNEWCRTKSYLKKGLQDYTTEELPALVSQAHLLYRHYLSF